MNNKTKSFSFLYPTTYEENKEELNRLNLKILEASKQRNYPLAKKLQQKYNYCVQVDNYFKNQKLSQEKDNEGTRLKNARIHEEETLKQKMTNKMSRTLSQYEQRLQAIEKKHQENLNQIETRFSSPRYAAYRPSPNIHQLLKAESFYANQHDFDAAEHYRNLIAQKAHQEIINSEVNNELSFAAAVENENHRYEVEKSGFHARLENEKIKLKKETERGLLQIKQKYSNLAKKNTEFNKKALNSPSNIHKTTNANTKTSIQLSTNVIASFNESNTIKKDSNLSKTSRTPRGNQRSFFVTTATSNTRQISTEDSVYKMLNDGFSDILQRTEVQNKNDITLPVVEPQPLISIRSPRSIKKSCTRSPRTARTGRRPTTSIFLSSTY